MVLILVEKIQKIGHKKLPVHSWFIHETHWFFKVFEIIEVNCSLILFFSKNQNQWFFNYELTLEPKLAQVFYKFK
jgi:hypothetical protein